MLDQASTDGIYLKDSYCFEYLYELISKKLSEARKPQDSFSYIFEFDKGNLELIYQDGFYYLGLDDNEFPLLSKGQKITKAVQVDLLRPERFALSYGLEKEVGLLRQAFLRMPYLSAQALVEQSRKRDRLSNALSELKTLKEAGYQLNLLMPGKRNTEYLFKRLQIKYEEMTYPMELLFVLIKELDENRIKLERLVKIENNLHLMDTRYSINPLYVRLLANHENLILFIQGHPDLIKECGIDLEHDCYYLTSGIRKKRN